MSLDTDIENSRANLLEIYKLAEIYGAEEYKNEEIYLELAKELIQIKEKNKRSKEALIAAQENASTMNDIETLYQKEMQKKKAFNANKTTEYKSFVKDLQSIREDALENSCTEVKINVYDPLTKRRMEIPVKNTICGHYYDRDTVLQYISKNPRTHCFISGCANEEFIAEEHLIEDQNLRKKIEDMESDDTD